MIGFTLRVAYSKCIFWVNLSSGIRVMQAAGIFFTTPLESDPVELKKDIFMSLSDSIKKKLQVFCCCGDCGQGKTCFSIDLTLKYL